MFHRPSLCSQSCELIFIWGKMAAIVLLRQVRQFLEPSMGSLGQRSSSRQRSGFLTPDSELADEEVDRLGHIHHHHQQQQQQRQQQQQQQQLHAEEEALGDGERALVHAMCNVNDRRRVYFFCVCVCCRGVTISFDFRWCGGSWKKPRRSDRPFCANATTVKQLNNQQQQQQQQGKAKRLDSPACWSPAKTPSRNDLYSDYY